MPARLSHAEYTRRLHEIHGSNVTVLEHYKNAYTKLLHRCHTCKSNWLTAPINILYSFSGCPACSLANLNNHLRLTSAEYANRLKGLGSTLQPLENYVTSQLPILHRCTVCGQEKTYKPNTLLNRQGCFVCAKDSAYRKRNVEIGGRIFSVQGYEDYALDYLIRVKGVSPDNLIDTVRGGKPHIKYTFAGKQHMYLPDFYYAPKNRVIEVKSLYTLGLLRMKCLPTVQAKARACLAQGFDFSLLLFVKRRRIKLPSNWIELSSAKLLTAINL